MHTQDVNSCFSQRASYNERVSSPSFLSDIKHRPRYLRKKNTQPLQRWWLVCFSATLILQKPNLCNSHTTPSNSTPGVSPKNSKTVIWKDTRTPVFRATLLTKPKTGEQAECPSTDEWIKEMSCMPSGILYSRKKAWNLAICSKLEVNGIWLGTATFSSSHGSRAVSPLQTEGNTDHGDFHGRNRYNLALHRQKSTTPEDRIPGPHRAPVLPVRDPGGSLTLPKLHIWAQNRPDQTVTHVSLPVNKYPDRFWNLPVTEHPDTECGKTQVSSLTAHGLFCHLCLLTLNSPLTSYPKMHGQRSLGKFPEPDLCTELAGLYKERLYLSSLSECLSLSLSHTHTHTHTHTLSHTPSFSAAALIPLTSCICRVLFSLSFTGNRTRRKNKAGPLPCALTSPRA